MKQEKKNCRIVENKSEKKNLSTEKKPTVAFFRSWSKVNFSYGTRNFFKRFTKTRVKETDRQSKEHFCTKTIYCSPGTCVYCIFVNVVLFLQNEKKNQTGFS